MNVIIGQGALAIVRHEKEAIIVDCRIPSSDDHTVAYLKEIMALSLREHCVKGLRVDKLANRHLTGLSGKFAFELFSPHIEDMDCSNNCSIVLKLTGLGARGFSYLITGDTENPEAAPLSWSVCGLACNGSAVMLSIAAS